MKNFHVCKKDKIISQKEVILNTLNKQMKEKRVMELKKSRQKNDSKIDILINGTDIHRKFYELRITI